MFSKITIEKATVFISLLGLFASLGIHLNNKSAEIKLEEKKLESTLFLKAIEVNNTKSTLENLTFLLKMGAISPEREEVIQRLTDSVYTDNNNEYYTGSDTVGFVDFYISNNKKDEIAYYQFVRGAYIQIVSSDSLQNLTIQTYTDYIGKAEVYYPKKYCGTFVHIKIMKQGYKTKEYDMQLPNFDNLDVKQTTQKIVLDDI